ncbi:MAG: hypothetical protein OH338_03640 [Candidatus Parvarchaeota archaeon]|nr:hypothetical protein [Candidatus Parvarchaeum tengchongense]MCW1312494.1 hypothetical protein [Candidatus Parvarchaeum tengchongense]
MFEVIQTSLTTHIQTAWGMEQIIKFTLYVISIRKYTETYADITVVEELTV